MSRTPPRTTPNLLTNEPLIVWADRPGAAVRVDVQATTTHIARIHGQVLRFEQAQEIQINAFDALLMEVRMLAEAHR